MTISKEPGLKDKLPNVSVVVDKKDLLIYTLNGLPSKYNVFRTSMRTRSQLVDFEELHVLLKSEESAIEKQFKRDDSLTQPTAMVAAQSHISSQQRQNFNLNFNEGKSSSFGRGRNQGRGRMNFASPSQNQGRGASNSFGQFPPHSQTVVDPHACQICFRLGHSALDCFNRMNYNYQGRHPPSQLAAMVATQNVAFYLNSSPNFGLPGSIGSSSTTWLANYGCNAHVTSDFGQFSVTHSGSDLLHTDSSSFSLNNLLRVLNIATNLLLVHQLCVDNNCLIVFYSSQFFVQDKTSGQTLFH